MPTLPTWITTQDLQAVLIVITSAVAGLGYWGVTRQIRQNRKAMQAQTFVTIVNTARTLGLSQTMDLIRSLRYEGATAYTDFRRSDRAEQERIRGVIDFFNDLQHLVRNDHLEQEHIVEIYYSSILDCADRLLPWWVVGFRDEHQSRHHPQFYYRSFVGLCNEVRKRNGQPEILIPVAPAATREAQRTAG